MKKRKIIFKSVILVISAITFLMLNWHKDKVIKLKEDTQGQAVSITIYKGKEYLHSFKINTFLTIKTPPQMAVWVEDLEGNYLETLYATDKIVYQKWSKAPSDNAEQIVRKEALPYWTHKRANSQMVADEVSSATPKGNALIYTRLSGAKESYRIVAEINMSTDFNEAYPKEATPLEDNYSGGKYGSGQPALVYEAIVEGENGKTYELLPIGHSSPDGSDEKLYTDLSKLTTAKDIIDRITFETKNE